MKKYSFEELIVTGAICAVFICAGPAAAAASARNTVSGIDVADSGLSTVIKLKYSEKARYNSFLLLENPYRLLIDLSDLNVFSDEKDSLINRGVVKNLRFEYEDSNLKSKPLLYIIFELNEMCAVEPELKDKHFTLRLNRFGSEIGEITQKQLAREIRTLKDALEIGVANSPSVRLAISEIELSKYKLRESYRALYPGLTAKYDQTRGEAVRETGVPEFDEKTYGLQLNQSLYYSGKLRATYKQARCNHEISKLKYEDMLLGVNFEIVKAYYNFVKSQKISELYAAFENETKNDISASEKRYKMKLATRIEYLTVETQRKQLEYNKVSSEKDLNLARLNLLHVLNIAKDSKINAAEDLPYKEIDVNLTQALRVSELKRADLKIAYKEVEAGELAKLIGKSSNGFKVDFTGFAGRSGGAYKTEELKMGEDYSAALKVSKPFGGSTFNTSYIFDKTSPKLGQSTRTESKTASASVGLFDNIKGYSDYLEGDISYRQSQIKLLEMRNNAEKEVRESLFNVEKAVLQVTSSSDEVRLAQEEVVAAKSKKDLNLAQISDLISSRIKLANAKKAHYEAAAYFNISLASLNKAVGSSREFTLENK